MLIIDLIIFPFALAAVWIHELGHLFAALLLRVKVEHVHLYFPGLSIRLDLGLTLAIGDEDPRGGFVRTEYTRDWRMIVVVVAGPLFNLVAVGGLLYICTFEIHPLIFMPLLGLMGLNLIEFVVNMFGSDGKLLLHFVRGKSLS